MKTETEVLVAQIVFDGVERRIRVARVLAIHKRIETGVRVFALTNLPVGHRGDIH